MGTRRGDGTRRRGVQRRYRHEECRVAQIVRLQADRIVHRRWPCREINPRGSLLRQLRRAALSLP